MTFKKLDGKFILRFEKNDDFFQTLLEFCKNEGVNSAQFNGIGSFLNCIIGFYNLDKKDYKKTKLEQTHEVISLTGNISLIENQPFIHSHVLLSDEETNTKGGHLFSGKTGATLEVFLEKFDTTLERKLNQEIGLPLLDL